MSQRHGDLAARRERLLAGGGPERIERQHVRGKLTARERLQHLFDEDSFVEVGLWARHCCADFGERDVPCDGVVTGKGEVQGRPVYAFAQDFTVSGGAVGARHAEKIADCMMRALRYGMPVVGINDSGGARIQEGVAALSGYGRIFHHNTMLSGVVPQISVIAGPCAGGAAYSPALTDFLVMVEGTATMFIAGPEVIAAATGERIGPEELGGAAAHAAIAGNIHFTAPDDRQALELTRRLLSYLPSNNLESPPDGDPPGQLADDDELDWIIPQDERRSYDVKEVIRHLVDADSFLEVQPVFAPNLVTGLARMAGVVVGVVANQPAHLAGVLDIDASDKGARFVRTCNVYNIPLITLVDVPGFLPGVAQEHGGIIRHGAKLLFAYSAATVPKLTVIMRKAYGGAYLAMCSKDMGADCVLAWPTAEIAVMGPEGAVGIVHRRELEQAPDRAALLRELVARYRETHANPFVAAGALQVDDVVPPAWTRRMLVERLGVMRAKRDLRPQKKHGNIPL